MHRFYILAKELSNGLRPGVLLVGTFLGEIRYKRLPVIGQKLKF